jgi:hypothetical protein
MHYLAEVPEELPGPSPEHNLDQDGAPGLPLLQSLFGEHRLLLCGVQHPQDLICTLVWRTWVAQHELMIMNSSSALLREAMCEFDLPHVWLSILSFQFINRQKSA